MIVCVCTFAVYKTNEWIKTVSDKSYWSLSKLMKEFYLIHSCTAMVVHLNSASCSFFKLL